MKRGVAILAAAALFTPGLLAQERYEGSEDLDRTMEEAVASRRIPGGVLLVGQGDRILHRTAYGQRALVPSVEPMTADTIFDVASLTKIVATSAALMKLFEQGRIRLTDPVTAYLPEFQGGRSGINIRHLMAHYSGLRPDLDLIPGWSGYEEGVRRALVDKPAAAPGQRFIYSDINYILLCEIVRRLTGESLADYAQKEIFDPLGMSDTEFLPPERLLSRIAPTEPAPGDNEPLRGVVHDPTTRYMGGVAGHSGVFSTATDLSRFARMILNGGELDGTRFVSEATVAKFTSPQSPPGETAIRGLGWDIDSPYSSNRGELFPIGSFGHTGFTGPSMWIDPSTRTYVILLTHRVHPSGGGNINTLRSRLATIAAAHAGIRVPGSILTGYNERASGAFQPVSRNGRVETGLDVLARQKFAALRNQRVGLITNHTGIDRAGRRNVDLMIEAGVNVTALFSPEHGIAGAADKSVGHGSDEATGLPVWSLYEEDQRRPTAEMLRGVDTLVFDIQDVGARFYTYTCTMLYAMEEAARRGIAFVVLDRPNPITGARVEGPLIERELESFVGCLALPVRHGMTVGEIARMANAERGIGARLTVIAMEGWERGDWFDSTGLPWVNPSPNMRSLNAATLYPALALLEYSPGYSVGRGTDAPFERIGAAWIRGTELSNYLNARGIAGVRFYPVRFQPGASALRGVWIEGVQFLITDRNELDTGRLGAEIAGALETLYPGRIDFGRNAPLIGSQEWIRRVKSSEDARIVHEAFAERLNDFLAKRSSFLLY
jgi:uncharacterized protein YbbC (DUF1343 family)